MAETLSDRVIEKTGQWQFADKVRIVVSRSSLPSLETAAGNPVFGHQSLAIEREKAKTDDLSGLIAVSAALSDNRLQIGIHTKDDIHGAAYIITTRQGFVTTLSDQPQAMRLRRRPISLKIRSRMEVVLGAITPVFNQSSTWVNSGWERLCR